MQKKQRLNKRKFIDNFKQITEYKKKYITKMKRKVKHYTNRTKDYYTSNNLETKPKILLLKIQNNKQVEKNTSRKL